MKRLAFAALCSSFFFLFPKVNSAASPSVTIASLSSTPVKADQPSEEQEEGVILFTPPLGWQLADPNLLPTHVRVMVVGKAQSNFPPSMNLSWEPYKGTLKQYLKIIKNMNSAQGYEWKDLGTIRTEAGSASLSQVDTKTQWGEVRLMHTILIKNGKVYILTASALKQEFSLFYKDFFSAMRSLRVVKDVYEMIDNVQQRTQLKASADQLIKEWQALLAQKQQATPEAIWKDIQTQTFASEQFQKTIWKPFQEKLNQKFGSLGTEWQSLFLQKIENRLFNIQP